MMDFVYKLAYGAFCLSFAIGIWADKNYEKSAIRIAQFIIILIVLIFQIVGIG